MLKNCKAVTEQTITLSNIGFAEVHGPSFLCHLTDFKYKQTLELQWKRQNTINFNYFNARTGKTEFSR